MSAPANFESFVEDLSEETGMVLIPSVIFNDRWAFKRHAGSRAIGRGARSRLPMVHESSSRTIGFIRQSDFDAIPSEPGAYLLALEIEKTFTLAIRTLPKTRLRAGFYLYCGSANGPGGLRARIARHFRKRKARHWHIDRLTERATSRAALILPNGDECALAHLIGGQANMQTPVPGFGATDCRRCESHLFFCGDV